ncbi:Tudor domain-containing protein, partial [Aphis craccivora]
TVPDLEQVFGLHGSRSKFGPAGRQSTCGGLRTSRDVYQITLIEKCHNQFRSSGVVTGLFEGDKDASASTLLLQFPLLNDTLNYLNVGIIGQIKRVKRNKYNLFIFHMLLQECECINDEDINLALLDEPVLPFKIIYYKNYRGLQSFPDKLRWRRCFSVSLAQTSRWQYGAKVTQLATTRAVTS